MQYLIGLLTRSSWGLQGLICLVAVLLISCAGLGATVAIENARLDAAKARQEALGNELTTQNLSVEKWKDEAEIQKQRVEAATAQGEKVRTVTVERVRTITVASIPSTCPDAIKWGAQQALEFNKHWESME